MTLITNDSSSSQTVSGGRDIRGCGQERGGRGRGGKGCGWGQGDRRRGQGRGSRRNNSDDGGDDNTSGSKMILETITDGWQQQEP